MKKIIVITLMVIGLSNCTTLELVKTVGTYLYKMSKTQYAGHYKVGNPYKVGGIWYTPEVDTSYDKTGVASWYGADFDGKLTSNGEMFDKDVISAAHKTLPLPSVVRVTNLENRKSMLIRVNDRGPYVNNRIIDLSEAAAKKLGVYQKGTAKVRVQFDNDATNKMFAHSSHKDYKRPKSHVGHGTAGHIKIAKKKNIPKRKDASRGLFVQSGAYSKYETAKKVAEDLKSISRVVIQEVKINNKNIFRVRMGPFSDEKDADVADSKANMLGYKDAIIVYD